MSRKVNKDFGSVSWDFLGKELKNILKDIKQEVSASRELALTEAARYLETKLIEETPHISGKLKGSWNVDKRYKGVRYIFNKDILPSGDGQIYGGIPKLNVIEYSKLHGHPFVRRTLEENKYPIEKLMEKILKEEK